ncbi:MAG: hypothetical protein ACR2Q4_11315 [Geminicoccaceae bacterium]
MRTLTEMPIRLWHRSRPAVAGLVTAASLMVGAAGTADAECTWIVQPHFGAEDRGPVSPLVNIVFDGLRDTQPYFYGFTVADIDLAWRLAAAGTLSELGPDGRALDVTETPTGQAFKLDAESIRPHTVYLVAAGSPVGELEDIDAAIEPSQPFNVSMLKTRGGTGVTGPLPSRSLPGFEIRAAEVETPVDAWLRAQKVDTAAENRDTASETEQDAQPKTTDLAAASETRHQDVDRQDVQICAYQVAMR